MVGPKDFENLKIIAGPYKLFQESFILEFLEPPKSLNATVLMRATYVKDHPLCKQGKKHPQSPPLHIHFDQSEDFMCIRGKIGTTEGYSATDRIATPADGVHEIKPWVPHSFWPVADAEEDSTLVVWAHPQDVPDPMDWLFFNNLLGYISDADAKKVTLNPLQIMLTNHSSASAMIMFPTAWWLGPLRWWVPWQIEGFFSIVAKALGYKELQERYTPKPEWEKFLEGKKRA